MRQLDEDMVARIESGAARLCHVWILRRRDAVRLGFTDHDRDLELDGVVCRAGSGWTVGAGDSAVGMSAGAMSAAGALDDEALKEEDIVAGHYDRARVDLWRVDWERPELRVHLWRGTLAHIQRRDGAFVADVEGPLAALDRVIGRTYGRLCDAVLGDKRCGVGPALVAQKTCDHSWGTCVREFGNGQNFRGFPDIPGDDFVLMRPGLAGQHDGKSRR